MLFKTQMVQKPKLFRRGHKNHRILTSNEKMESAVVTKENEYEKIRAIVVQKYFPEDGHVTVFRSGRYHSVKMLPLTNAIISFNVPSLDELFNLESIHATINQTCASLRNFERITFNQGNGPETTLQKIPDNRPAEEARNAREMEGSAAVLEKYDLQKKLEKDDEENQVFDKLYATARTFKINHDYLKYLWHRLEHDGEVIILKETNYTWRQLLNEAYISNAPDLEEFFKQKLIIEIKQRVRKLSLIEAANARVAAQQEEERQRELIEMARAEEDTDYDYMAMKFTNNLTPECKDTFYWSAKYCGMMSELRNGELFLIDTYSMFLELPRMPTIPECPEPDETA